MINHRIPFGKEERLEIIAASCPGCGASHGQNHEYGCPLETCKDCGGRLMDCSCMSLPIPEELRLLKDVARKLTREEVLKMADTSPLLDKNYRERAGFSWILENMPPELKQEANEMAMDILGGKKAGDNFLVPNDKAAEILGLSQEEAEPILQEFENECLYPGWQDSCGQKQ